MTTETQFDAVTFDQRLQAFEQVLGLPLISGELDDWLRRVCDESAVFMAEMDASYATRQKSIYAQIEREDPELNSQVQKMREENGQLLAEMTRIQDKIVATGCKVTEPAEEMRNYLSQLVDEAFQVIGRMRRHEIEVREWLAEALYRDRGEGD